MRKVRRIAGFIGIAVLSLWGARCGEGIYPIVVPEIPSADLASAPDTIEVAGSQVTLWASLWRDFQPISPPDGKPLISLVRLIETDSLRIDGAISPMYIWVVNGDHVWASRFTDEARPPQPEYQIEKVARNGPKWGPGISVDVIVGIRYHEEPMILIAARNQLIYRTD